MLTLYGMSASMFTGKARSYLRTRGVRFVEVAPGAGAFAERVIPEIGRMIIPVLQTQDGAIVQDTADIIDRLEAERTDGGSVLPEGPRRRIAARVLELFGDEPMIRVAMHYRWNRPENLGFLEASFGSELAPRADPATRALVAETAMNRMRSYLPLIGLSESVIPALEAGYEALLAAMNAHLSTRPFLLGDAPTVGDYGMISGFHAHLARDPWPAFHMKRHAYAVFRWTERMTAPERSELEFPDPSGDEAQDHAPESLIAVLQAAAALYADELRASVEALNAAVLAVDPPSGAPVDDPDKSRRVRAEATFDLNGATCTARLRPFVLWKLQKITDDLDALAPEARAETDALLDRSGWGVLKALRPARRVERRANREVWG